MSIVPESKRKCLAANKSQIKKLEKKNNQNKSTLSLSKDISDPTNFYFVSHASIGKTDRFHTHLTRHSFWHHPHHVRIIGWVDFKNSQRFSNVV